MAWKIKKHLQGRHLRAKAKALALEVLKLKEKLESLEVDRKLIQLPTAQEITAVQDSKDQLIPSTLDTKRR